MRTSVVLNCRVGATGGDAFGNVGVRVKTCEVCEVKLFVKDLTNERLFRQAPGTQNFGADYAVQAALLQKGSRILPPFFKTRLCTAENHWVPAGRIR